MADILYTQFPNNHHKKAWACLHFCLDKPLQQRLDLNLRLYTDAEATVRME